MSRLDVKEITDEAGRAGYERLNRISPQGSVFSSLGWIRYNQIEARLFGVYKGSELVAGTLVPLAGGNVLRVVPGTPWWGPVARSSDEGENLAVAEGLVECLLRSFGEATLTMNPEWHDVRGFIWSGLRTHVRYTYRGVGYRMHDRYEKRLVLRRVSGSEDDWKQETVHEDDGWKHLHIHLHDSEVDILEDWWGRYYWKANPGGTWHSEIISNAMHRELSFDMVGCNSPQRGLFKRQFGGWLIPYYCVTTADPKDIAEFWPPQEASAA